MRRAEDAEDIQIEIDSRYFFTSDGCRNYTLYERRLSKYGYQKKKLAPGEEKEVVSRLGYASTLESLAGLYARKAVISDDGIANFAALERRLAEVKETIAKLVAQKPPAWR